MPLAAATANPAQRSGAGLRGDRRGAGSLGPILMLEKRVESSRSGSSSRSALPGAYYCLPRGPLRDFSLLARALPFGRHRPGIARVGGRQPPMVATAPRRRFHQRRRIPFGKVETIAANL